MGVVRDPLAFVQGLFARSLLRPAAASAARSSDLVPARRFADLRGPGHRHGHRPRHRRAAPLRRRRRGRAAGGGALRHLRVAGRTTRPCSRRASLRRRGAPGTAAARGGGAGSRTKPWSRWTSGRASTSPPPVRPRRVPADGARPRGGGGRADGRQATAAQLALWRATPAARRWSTSGRRSSATLPSGWIGCASMPRTAIARRARRCHALGQRLQR